LFKNIRLPPTSNSKCTEFAFSRDGRTNVPLAFNSIAPRGNPAQPVGSAADRQSQDDLSVASLTGWRRRISNQL